MNRGRERTGRCPAKCISTCCAFPLCDPPNCIPSKTPHLQCGNLGLCPFCTLHGCCQLAPKFLPLCGQRVPLCLQLP